MKRFLPLLFCLGLTVSSCGLFHIPMSSTHNPAYPFGASPAGAVVSSVVVPNPRHLQAQEDRGTGLYGYLNEYGMWVIAPSYAYAVDFDEELGIAIVSPRSGFWGAINVYGQTVIDFKFDSRYDVQAAIQSMKRGRYQGIDLWTMYDRGTELYGFLDYYGNWYIQPQFRDAGDMSDDGFAVVQFMDEMWGVIDRKCQIIIQPNFRSKYDAETALRNLLRR